MADAAIALGRTPGEIAATCSLPEVKLLLARANARFARQAIGLIRGVHVASAAKWSKDAHQDLNAYLREMQEIADPRSVAPQTASRKDLAAVFAGLGVPLAPATVPSGAPNR